MANTYGTSTLPVKVKIVREAALAEREVQIKDMMTSSVTKVKLINEYNARDNLSWFRRTFLKPIEMMDPEATAQEWKELWESGKMNAHHPGFWIFQRTRDSWYARLKQMCRLPEEDDEKVMMVSLNDLHIIEYNRFMAEYGVK